MAASSAGEPSVSGGCSGCQEVLVAHGAPKNSPTEPQVNSQMNPAPAPKADPTPSPSSGPPGLDTLNSVQKLMSFQVM